MVGSRGGCAVHDGIIFANMLILLTWFKEFKARLAARDSLEAVGVASARICA